MGAGETTKEAIWSMTEIEKMSRRTRDLNGPQLRPCEGCGGTADYARVEGLMIVARCTACGRQTGPRVDAKNAARDWNRRITSGARVVTLAELRSRDFDCMDDDDAVAVWMENREGVLTAMLLRFDIDMGEPVVKSWQPGAESLGYWPDSMMADEGVGWRLWDRKPTECDRAAASWGQMWVESFRARADALLAEALETARKNEEKRRGIVVEDADRDAYAAALQENFGG